MYLMPSICLSVISPATARDISSAGALWLMLLSTSASAHHSTSYFSNEFIEIEGNLVEVDWTNPHVGFTLMIVNDQGQEELWSLEATTVYILQRKGVTQDLFQPGERIRVAGRVSTRDERAMLSTNMFFENGREILTNPQAELRWNTEQITEKDLWVPDNVRQQDVGAENRGIFRVWSQPAEGLENAAFVWRDGIPFLEEVIAARADWDPVENTVTRCEPPGMPSMMETPYPVEFIERGSSIELIGVANNSEVTRTIYLEDQSNAAAQAPSPSGYSVGHWEGNTLTVETTRINYPYFDNIGTPLSETLKIVEEFSLRDNQSRLDFRMTAVDPAMFTGPAVLLEYYWLALGETVERQPCGN